MVIKNLTMSFVVLSVSVLMLCNCKQKKQYGDVIIIDDADAVEVNFEEVAKNVRVVPIISDTVIGSCSKIMSYGNETFMLDRNSRNIYYIEDSLHISTLSHQGNGPGEYNMISYFNYSPINKILYVYSNPDSKVYWYKVPEMTYCGFTPLTGLVSNISIHDESSLLVVRSDDKMSSTWIQLIDIPSGSVIKNLRRIGGFAYSENDMVSYRPSNKVYSIAGYIDSLCVISEDNAFDVQLEYSFGEKNFPEDLIDYEIFDNNTFIEFLQYLNGPDGQDKLCGNYYPIISDKGISFWYHKAMSSFNQLNFFRINGKVVENWTGFMIPGINRQIVPKGITDSGYIYVFEGYADSYLDSEVVSSPLAKKILDAMKSQNDNNQVLLFFEI